MKLLTWNTYHNDTGYAVFAFRILPAVPMVYIEWVPTVPSVTISSKNRRKPVFKVERLLVAFGIIGGQW